MCQQDKLRAAGDVIRPQTLESGLHRIAEPADARKHRRVQLFEGGHGVRRRLHEKVEEPGELRRPGGRDGLEDGRPWLSRHVTPIVHRSAPMGKCWNAIDTSAQTDLASPRAATGAWAGQ